IAVPEILPMAAVNAAYRGDGVQIRAPQAVGNRVVHVIFVGASGAEAVGFHPRSVIEAAPNGTLTVVESHVGLPGQAYFANPVTEIAVGNGAVVRRYVHVSEDSEAVHMAVSAVKIAAGGRYEAFHLATGGGLVRQEIHVEFTG